MSLATYRDELIATAKAIAAPGKGILAADESTGTIGKRFESINLANTEENRRAYRELLFTTQGGFEKYISGVIMYEETLYQSTTDGRRFVDVLKAAGVLTGIKVDKGLDVLPDTDGETVTMGLDGLVERCRKYYQAGARFAKWRAVLKIGPNEPSNLAYAENARTLARYARICQECGLAPIVEPEVLMDGPHSIERCAEVTQRIVSEVVRELEFNGVLFEGMMLKPNMVTAGSEFTPASTPEEIAKFTVQTLRRTLPAAVPSVNFLSGGQSEEAATLNLNAMNKDQHHPWALSFSYGRALQKTVIKTWAGLPENVEAAQKAFLHRAQANGLAQLGKYTGSDQLGAAATESLFQSNYRY